METRWHEATDMQDWLAQALAWVGRAEAQALARHGAFHVVLAGGSTPRLLYEALAREPHDWGKWQMWLGDERCLPADDPERNSHMVRASLLQAALVPDSQFHPIPAESGAVQGASEYSATLTNVGAFDLVLLGLGEDGHTASLFPGHHWGASSETPDAIPVHDAPKPPSDRISLSARRLAQARQVLFLVTGAGKRDALARWLTGEAIPASAIRPPGGVDVLVTAESLPPGVHP